MKYSVVTRRLGVAAVVVAGVLSTAPVASAQQAETGPKVGEVAPDFALAGATRYGLLRDQVKLSDYRGQTVVIAFFFKARTRG